MSLPVLIITILFALAAFLFGRKRPLDERSAIIDAGIERIRSGESNVRLIAGRPSMDARAANIFNALMLEFETGSANHDLHRSGALYGALRAEIAGHLPSADAVPMFVAIAEIDRFMTLRRSVGYSLGNQIVALVADRIRRGVAGAEIGRVGRTTIEFAFPAASSDNARVALDAAITAIERRVVIEGYEFELAANIGFADAGSSSIHDELLDRAAAALAAAQHGRQKIRFADADILAQRSFADLEMMRALPPAMANGELTLHYQPKLNARTNSVDSVEALLRWTSPSLGLVPTARFIEVAEETGAIRDLTEWVLRRAVRDQATLAEAGHDIEIYVNLSGQLLPDDAFAKRILAIVADAPGLIGLEITETAVITDPEVALANLAMFSAAGIRIAIDDYGSGLSSLAYLKQLPADELKIDRLFISGLTESHRDPLLVRSSIDLAHALEMEVTAEGVDDPIALALLRVMGCDLLQGYLISPPIPIPALIAFLDDGDGIAMFGAPVVASQPWQQAS